jgi:hypothetical protein
MIRAVPLLVVLLCGCGGASTRSSEPSSPPKKTSFDLSTEEGVQAAYREATGSKQTIYVHRSEHLPGIIVVNDRIPDLGDRFVGVFVDGRWYPEGKELEPVLAALGWKTADHEARVEIVRKWVEGSARYGSVIREPVSPSPVPDATPNPGIKPPVFSATGDGGVRADLWVVTGWNIAGRPMYQQRTLTFSSDGSLVR